MADKITYSNTPNKTSEFLRLTITLLAKHKISAHPHNYQLGYEYVSGKNQLLIDDLDKLIEQSNSPEEKQLSNYTETLHQFIDILDNQNSSSLLEETHSLEKSQQRLESQIFDIVAEVDSLRKELQQVKEESKIDALTGIANRKAFDATLEHSILTSRETNKPFCLLLLDIDHFKKFNDTYGHLIGDKVLRYVAASLKRSVKGNDCVARFGGEEFVIILPATSINGGMTVAEQIRKAVSSGTLTDKGSDISYGKTMISIGVTQFRASDLSNELVGRADKALYLAKERGRNRVEKL
ncbi:MAG: GGDEF domain-containing protein [gamma proteobacterium symbiont of Lucinoma myriamae]|nr:GGDEF domain-containing protein [gamma proteobacterium symbiont of Lucinoma myriamae]MCU7833521.1 GGDEF domain-containing protein [gamma proteobacterium symbiont of Lucinoma myriamae]